MVTSVFGTSSQASAGSRLNSLTLEPDEKVTWDDLTRTLTQISLGDLTDISTTKVQELATSLATLPNPVAELDLNEILIMNLELIVKQWGKPAVAQIAQTCLNRISTIETQLNDQESRVEAVTANLPKNSARSARIFELNRPRDPIESRGTEVFGPDDTAIFS